jgi:hypothetical protein
MKFFKKSDGHYINVAQATEVHFEPDHVTVRFGTHTVDLHGTDAKRFRQAFEKLWNESPNS